MIKKSCKNCNESYDVECFKKIRGKPSSHCLECYNKKRMARRMVGFAIKAGVLKTKECVLCEEDNVDAHHPDYNFPNQIVWLCPSCHSIEHIKLRAKRPTSWDKFIVTIPNLKITDLDGGVIKGKPGRPWEKEAPRAPKTTRTIYLSVAQNERLKELAGGNVNKFIKEKLKLG